MAQPHEWAHQDNSNHITPHPTGGFQVCLPLLQNRRNQDKPQSISFKGSHSSEIGVMTPFESLFPPTYRIDVRGKSAEIHYQFIILSI